MKIKTALRSVLNELDEETEVLPHIKTSKDFEVYEPIVMHPLFQILPWDDNVKPTYELSFKVNIVHFFIFLIFIIINYTGCDKIFQYMIHHNFRLKEDQRYIPIM